MRLSRSGRGDDARLDIRTGATALIAARVLVLLIAAPETTCEAREQTSRPALVVVLSCCLLRPDLPLRDGGEVLDARHTRLHLLRALRRRWDELLRRAGLVISLRRLIRLSLPLR